MCRAELLLVDVDAWSSDVANHESNVRPSVECLHEQADFGNGHVRDTLLCLGVDVSGN